MSLENELAALRERWRSRARRFMDEAERARTSVDVARLTAMASTLEWAATDMAVYSTPVNAALALTTAQDEGPAQLALGRDLP